MGKSSGGGGGGGKGKSISGGGSANNSSQTTSQANNGLNETQQAQLRKIQESTQNLSAEQLQARRRAAENDIKTAETQIAKYKETVEQMKRQESWTPEQAKQYAFKNNTYPKIGEKARLLKEERLAQIEKMESAKKVLQAWLKQ